LKEELEMLRARVSGATLNQEATFDPSVPPEKQIVTYRTKEGEIKRVTKAELQEQLQASEKLMKDLNETWEEKLARTQQVQKEREQALEELGITVERDVIGVHAPKKVCNLLGRDDCLTVIQIPHLVNLVSKSPSNTESTIELL
jgi:kinesin family protein 1